jgi:hypothetical protein
MLRIPHCLDNRLVDGGKFVELGTIAMRDSKAYRSLTFCWFITNLLIGKVRRIFEVFKVVKSNMAIFMIETPYSLVRNLSTLLLGGGGSASCCAYFIKVIGRTATRNNSSGCLFYIFMSFSGSAVAQRLRHYATNRKVAGSIPDEENF